MKELAQRAMSRMKVSANKQYTVRELFQTNTSNLRLGYTCSDDINIFIFNRWYAQRLPESLLIKQSSGVGQTTTTSLDKDLFPRLKQLMSK